MQATSSNSAYEPITVQYPTIAGKTMKLQMMEVECKNCATKYEVPAIPPVSYGEFLLRTENGELAVLDAFSDSTYEEVSQMLVRVFGKSLSGDAEADLLQQVYGFVACDPGSQGAKFDVQLEGPCPKCAGTGAAHWRFPEPPKLVEMEVPSVTHYEWQKLSGEEKEGRVQQAVAKRAVIA